MYITLYLIPIIYQNILYTLLHVYIQENTGLLISSFYIDGTRIVDISDPNNPIAPVCPLEEQHSCDTPMRLMQGWPFGYTSRIPGADKWKHTNYRVNLDWTPNGDQLFYFGATSGYRAGGVALGYSGARDVGRDEFGIPLPGDLLEAISYDKETVESVEFGYKGIHMDDKLQIFASIYQYDYDGYQDVITQFDPLRGESAEYASNSSGLISRK